MTHSLWESLVVEGMEGREGVRHPDISLILYPNTGPEPRGVGHYALFNPTPPLRKSRN